MRRNYGFTLIELLVVVAIVGILAAIAMPIYEEQVRKGRRADAMQAVGDLQLAMESWRSENPSYAAGCAGCGSGTYPTVPSSSFYTINLGGPPSETAYTITATPTGVQAGDRCGVLTATRNSKPTWATAGCK